MYKRTAAAFDEGGIEGLLLNHLRVKDDRSSLVLDSSTPLQTTVQLVDDVEVDMRDIRSMSLLHFTVTVGSSCEHCSLLTVLELLTSIDFKVVQMCPTFAAFTFQQVRSSHKGAVVSVTECILRLYCRHTYCNLRLLIIVEFSRNPHSKCSVIPYSVVTSCMKIYILIPVYCQYKVLPASECAESLQNLRELAWLQITWAIQHQ